MNLKRKWTVYMIHHSHLDMGYTHTVSEISARYYRFIIDILKELDRIKSGESENKNYKYTVESYWIIDNFLKSASEEWINKLRVAIREGSIEVTGSYFNFTDSIHPKVYGSLVERAKTFVESAGRTLKSAMFSDVNGLNVTYAMELADRGVEILFTNVHSGHGIFALNEKLVPFRWELPNGKSLIVYNGDLYTYGNEFGFCPRGAFSDVMSDDGYDAKSYNYDNKIDKWMELPEKRFQELLGYLESENHKFDFIAMGLHGTDDDNAIPNPGIVKRINEWNERSGNQVEVKLVTLEEFLNEIKDDKNIEGYQGDWADWWSDGIGTAPYHYQYFKRLQTEYLYYKDVAPHLTQRYEEEIDTTIAMFAEHTFGHFLSIDNPHLEDAGKIQLVKESHIGRLIGLVNDIKYQYFNEKGANNYSVDISNKILLTNPTDVALKSVVTLKFDKFDLYTYPAPYKITDSKGRNYPYFMKEIEELRAAMPHIYVELEPREALEITVESIDDRENEISLFEKPYEIHAAAGFDCLTDISLQSIPKSKHLFDRVMMSEDCAEQKRFLIKWDEKGISSFYDKENCCELLKGPHGLGSPIFEINKEAKGSVRDDLEANRRYKIVGRNKKTLMSDREFGVVDYVDLEEDNPYYFQLVLYFKLKHFDLYKQVVRVYKDINKIECKFIITKEYVKAAHNLFIALPFTDTDSKVYLDRGDVLLEAWEDMLPGTLTEYNTVYSGMKVERDDVHISVAMPDVFLIALKNYKYEPSILMCDDIKNMRQFDLYSWPICNIWHCNFFARESNYLNLNYTIEWEKKGNSMIEKSEQDRQLLEVFRQSSLSIIQHKV